MGDDGALGQEGDAVHSGTEVRRGGSGWESDFVRRVVTRRFKKRSTQQNPNPSRTALRTSGQEGFGAPASFSGTLGGCRCRAERPATSHRRCFEVAAL